MKKNSIVKKLIITFTSITGGVLILVGLIISIWFFRSDKIEKSERVNSQLAIIEKSISDYLNQGDATYEEINNLLKIVCIGSDMDILIVDRLGYVYMVSDTKYDNYKYTKIDLPPDDNSSEIYKQEIEQKDGSKVSISAHLKPMYTYEQLNGYFIIIDKSPLRGMESGRYMIMIIWTSIILAMIFATTIVKYSAKKLVIDPLEAINNAAKRLAIGDVNKRVEVISDNEIGELAQSFNIMAESIEQSDTTRKEFISNVSHELRSPITSIKGFIGGILDGVIPRDKENYYLNIVYDEVDRLTRLVNDLLDISAMEAGKFNLDISEFDINQTISLCILNLENKIKTKGLNLKCTFSDNRAFVIGDRDRIIQVITNLMENAVKYSLENGQVEVKVSSKGEKIFVSIFNSGDMISKEDINNIWDRFYKSDKSRTNKISTGLGLPIVRLILSQHNEDIWVENVEGKGVKFTFTLRKIS